MRSKTALVGRRGRRMAPFWECTRRWPVREPRRRRGDAPPGVFILDDYGFIAGTAGRDPNRHFIGVWPRLRPQIHYLGRYPNGRFVAVA